MAYQNVGTPRFYINVIEWLDSLGMTTSNGGSRINVNGGVNILPMNLWHTLSASKNTTLLFEDDVHDRYITFPQQGIAYNSIIGEKAFVAYLGHNFNSQGDIDITLNGSPYSDGSITTQNANGIVNWDGIYSPVAYNGFSIVTGDMSGVTTIPNGTTPGGYIGLSSESPILNPQLNSIVLGSYYDMPHSPDLKLTLTREMDGVKRIRTKGGNDLVKHQYIKPASWGDLGAWELKLQSAPYPYSNELSHSGRRIWDLSFSYLQDKDVFPEVSTISTHESRAYAHSDFEWYNEYGSNTEEFGLLRDNGFGNINFYAEVIHKTNGGQLPFIFQPNKDDNTQFAICKFDMDSFKFKQVANGVYNMKLKIREVW